MREILFKAKRLDNGEWVHGYIVRHPSAVQIGESSPWYIHVPPVDPDDNGGVFNVDPETVCQYTGLTDKNGKKVFENDLVKCQKTDDLYEMHETGFVVCDGTRFLVKSSNPNFDVFLIPEMWRLEVIGNIHHKEADHED